MKQLFQLLFAFGLLIAGVNRILAHDDEPILYSKSTPANRLSELQEKINAGEVALAYDEKHGYLPASSQVLSFSKTSIQRPKISPARPRAIYYTDDIYIGFVQEGLLEIAVSDTKLGTVFYTQDQEKVDRPKFLRGTNQCLTCHDSLKTRNVPGPQVRSVFVEEDGEPIIALGSFRVDHTTPIKNRWGGWYVTGKHGEQTHLGNLIGPKVKKAAEVDNSQGMNVTDLSPRVDVKPYLSPHSDLVSLMVLDHQADAQNFITKANFETRMALYANEQAKKSGEEVDKTAAKTEKKIRAAADALTKYLLFSGEAPLTSSMSGTTPFRDEFSRSGIRDSKGRSLKDLDLERRLFKFPCSYMIYSPSFDSLPLEVSELVYQQLVDVLIGNDQSSSFSHLSADDRQAIREILLETKTTIPDRWRKELE